MNKLIEFQNVTKEYHSGETILKAADNLNFTIDEGEFVIILGPSGSGKSTMLNLLGGLDKLTTGNIYIDGEDITTYNDNELTNYRAHKIGFIFQFYNLIPNLTAKENVELISDVTNMKIDGKKILSQVGADINPDNFPSELSGGQQQRVSIARAIAKNPRVLLCDEPTGALDSETGYNIISLLHDLSIKNKTTVVIVTHNTMLAEIAHKVIHIKNGKIENIDINENPKSIDEIDW